MVNLQFSDDEFSDDEYPDENDFDDSESLFIDCPNCHAAVYEDAEQCPECGNYIIHHSTVFAGRSWWWIALGVLGIVAMILSLTIQP